MRLDNNICLGGRFNNKDIIGIKYNGYIIYEAANIPSDPVDPYSNVYTVKVIEYPSVTRMDVDNKTCLTDKSLLTDWGDGITDSEYVHNYQPNADDDCNYRIVTTGFLENAAGGYTGNTKYIVAVEQIRPDIINASGLFCGYENVTTENLFLPETSSMTNMNHMFAYCKSLTTLDLNSFDTSNVTTMYGMFRDCTNLTSLDLSNFDTSNVTTMHAMFYNCNNLTTLDLSNFDTGNVTSMYLMFGGCNKLTSLNMNNCDVSNVTDMDSMFFNCSALVNFQAPININVHFSVDTCTLLSHDSLMSIINNLATVTGKILTLGATNLAKLTYEEKTIATGKGWTLN